ncbi:MAG: ISTde1, transposase [Candidatus Roizmanbacteria bacterium GW2011_GWA2_33_33]|uniref:ISTde1, transposase n=2 Tax=Candidatus Roizmaniibacteriota TaxID=1752723 RepID=A0A0G0AU34_9BACT|nr:MAG: ISTde1, transposase [Candidatus Roizmanbacteria bacterium GW2011_GWA2_33_33]KKP60469.1 MAG: ISTde1, transposase [Candidatus Roizmanbacteria bacterium GW2011_GWC2_34_23]
MKERIMTTIEQLRTTVIEELVEGKIYVSTAAIKLNLSTRQVKRLKRSFKEKGYEALIHGSRGRPGVKKININLENNIVKIINEKYHDFGPTLIFEKLQEFHEINLSDETIRAIMIRNQIWQSHKRKRSQYFSWRERRSSYGELQQFDGSYHDWFEGRNPSLPEVCLLASIDDATGKITYAKFDHNESMTTVFRFWWEYIESNGIPSEIYLDKFSTYKINHKMAEDNSELPTQFKRAMKELGTTLISANTPQAKGRIERLFETLQDRLIKEMRLLNIDNIETANVFLEDKFVPWFNRRFAVTPKSTLDCHRSLDSSTTSKLKSIFAKHYVRGINNDFTIQYKTKWYQLKQIQPLTVYKTDKVLIEERLDNSIEIKYKDHYLNFFELPDKSLKVMLSPIVLTEHKSNWIPPADHPWRQFSYA